MGFEPVTFWSLVQHPYLLSHIAGWQKRQITLRNMFFLLKRSTSQDLDKETLESSGVFSVALLLVWHLPIAWRDAYMLLWNGMLTWSLLVLLSAFLCLFPSSKVQIDRRTCCGCQLAFLFVWVAGSPWSGSYDGFPGLEMRTTALLLDLLRGHPKSRHLRTSGSLLLFYKMSWLFRCPSLQWYIAEPLHPFPAEQHSFFQQWVVVSTMELSGKWACLMGQSSQSTRQHKCWC